MSTIKENFAEMVLLLCGMLGYRRTYINIHMCTVHCTVYACGSGEPVYSNTTIVQYILHLHTVCMSILGIFIIYIRYCMTRT